VSVHKLPVFVGPDTFHERSFYDSAGEVLITHKLIRIIRKLIDYFPCCSQLDFPATSLYRFNFAINFYVDISRPNKARLCATTDDQT